MKLFTQIAFVALIVFLATASLAQTSITITVHNVADVKGDSVLIGHIAQVTANVPEMAKIIAAVRVTDAPKVNGSVQVTANQIRTALNALPLDMNKVVIEGSEYVTVIRAVHNHVLEQTERSSDDSMLGSTRQPEGISIKFRVRPTATQNISTPGRVKSTNQPLDICINGEGFFQVELPNGDTGYTRDGAFGFNNQRRVVTKEGYLLVPHITIPDNVAPSEIDILPDGTVQVRMAGETTTADVGQITVATFPNPSGLAAIGRNLFRQSPTSGEATVGFPNSEARGALVQHALEMSNADIVEEMVGLIRGVLMTCTVGEDELCYEITIRAQHASDINSKSIQTSDEMLGLANSLKR